MKITDIHVEQFGAWQDLRLDLPEDNLVIVHGPNEAGKTTLLRFIRGVLYGFPPPDELPASLLLGLPSENGSAKRSGSLGLAHAGNVGRVRRFSAVDSDELIELHRDGENEPPADWLAELTQGIDDAFYQKVFAIGLGELQELGTLHADDVADRIYGLTLGPEGQRLLDTWQRLNAERQRLFDPQTNSGELIELCNEYDRLTGELRSLDRIPREHRELSRERARLEASIEDLKRRKSGLQSQLRGNLCLQRVWGPWNRVRQCTEELERLPLLADFPENGLQRLEKLEHQLAEATRERDVIVADVKKLRKQYASHALDPKIRTHAGSIQGLLDQREWMREVEQQATATAKQLEGANAELDKRLKALGPAWNSKRLAAVDTGPAGHYRLANMARSFRAALVRRARFRRVCSRLETACQERTAAIRARVQELGGQSVEEALGVARERLAGFEHLGRMRLRESELQQRQLGIDEQRERLEMRLVLPGWVYLLLGFFIITGIVLVILGITEGVRASGLVGAIYTLVGATCSGIAWALKSVFERDVQDRVDYLEEEARVHRLQLRATQDEIARLTDVQIANFTPPELDPEDSLPEAALIQYVTQCIAELEQLDREEKNVVRLERLLERKRSLLQACEREVGTARQSWQELLSQLGFPQDLGIQEAFDAWKAVVEAADQGRQRDAVQRELERLRWITQSFRKRVEDLGRRMECFDANYEKPDKVLLDWEAQLKTFAENRRQRTQLRKQIEAKTRELSRHRKRIVDLTLQRDAWLVRGGAADRDEFVLRAEQAARRVVLQEQLVEARRELQTAAQADKDLAIAEEDLRAYDADANAECIEMLKLELEDLERDLRESYESLGSVKQKLQTLELDPAPRRCRQQREQVAALLARRTEEWRGLQVSLETLAVIRRRFERECQPAALARASRFLERLTHGRYRNIWSPLGERRLCIDDEQGRSLTVEQLSRGTREQLFLAVRFALVAELASQGIQLPMVLDDVTVNFDEERTEATLDVLRELSAAGHQVLFFTSRASLAEACATRGMSPIFLPQRRAREAEAA